MNPEVIEELDAARDALALVDAALSGDDAAAQLIVAQWADDGSVLLHRLLGVTEVLTRKLGELTGKNPHQLIAELRNAIAHVEGEIQ